MIIVYSQLYKWQNMIAMYTNGHKVQVKEIHEPWVRCHMPTTSTTVFTLSFRLFILYVASTFHVCVYVYIYEYHYHYAHKIWHIYWILKFQFCLHTPLRCNMQLMSNCGQVFWNCDKLSINHLLPKLIGDKQSSSICYIQHTYIYISLIDGVHSANQQIIAISRR